MSRSRYTLLIDSLIHWLKKFRKFQSVSRTFASGVSYYISSSCYSGRYYFMDFLEWTVLKWFFGIDQIFFNFLYQKSLHPNPFEKIHLEMRFFIIKETYLCTFWKLTKLSTKKCNLRRKWDLRLQVHKK